VERDCKLRNVIIDHFNIIPAGTEIGYDSEADRENYHVDESGIVVVPCGDRMVSRVY